LHNNNVFNFRKYSFNSTEYQDYLIPNSLSVIFNSFTVIPKGRIRHNKILINKILSEWLKNNFSC